MDFLRAVSIILVVANVYWFCYEAIRLWGVDIGVVDRILMNFNHGGAVPFHPLHETVRRPPAFALSCLGTKGVKGEKITWEGSGRHLPQGSCCSSSTGGYWHCRCRLKR